MSVFCPHGIQYGYVGVEAPDGCRPPKAPARYALSPEETGRRKAETADTLNRIWEAQRPGREAMDHYAQVVLAAGWKPEQCTVKHYTAPDGTKTETLMCDVSVVEGYIRGHEVFELKTAMVWRGDQLVVEQTPRFIALPPTADEQGGRRCP